jgi:hypothetical protein
MALPGAGVPRQAALPVPWWDDPSTPAGAAGAPSAREATAVEDLMNLASPDERATVGARMSLLSEVLR